MMLHDSNEEKITQGSIRRPTARLARQPRPANGLPGQAFGAEICGGLMCVKVLVYAAANLLLFTLGGIIKCLDSLAKPHTLFCIKF